MSDTFDFDHTPDRRGTACVKWDEEPYADVIPLWVADMDFKAAPVIVEALQRRVDHGVFGYAVPDLPYYAAINEWFTRRHGVTVNREDVIVVPGIVPALSAIIRGLAPQGSAVIIQSPVYNCFFSSIRNNGCEIADAPLIRQDFTDGTFTYRMDFEALERQASRPEATLMVLCNPHNPAGRLWTREELTKLSDICARHGVTIVSDEIHCELTAPGTQYVPMVTVNPDIVYCISPSKAFNTAGLHIGNIVCGDPDKRARIDRAVNINEVCDVNPFGIDGLKAAYTEHGAEWLDACRDYLWQNYDLLRSEFAKHLPQCPVSRLEATYLVWVDVTAVTDDATRLEQRLVEEARVHVNSGEMYGDNRYIRINLACPRARLQEGIKRIVANLSPLR